MLVQLMVNIPETPIAPLAHIVADLKEFINRHGLWACWLPEGTRVEGVGYPMPELTEVQT